MPTKQHVENVLRINGLSVNASNEDIKSVLLYAKCDNLEEAIEALRSQQVSGDEDICGIQRSSGAQCNILLSDKRLRPETIKDLLGIDVEVEFSDIEAAQAQRQRVSMGQMLSIAGFSILCAVGILATVIMVL